MADPSSLMSAVDRLPAPVAWTCAGVFVSAIIAFYAGVPGFSLMSGELVGALSVAAALALLLPFVKLWSLRAKKPRVGARFKKLSAEQREFLLSVQRSGRSYFKGYAAEAPWFGALCSLGYVQLSRPFILVPGEPATYEITPQGALELSRAIAAA